jgi:hypothetical protein
VGSRNENGGREWRKKEKKGKGKNEKPSMYFESEEYLVYIIN